MTTDPTKMKKLLREHPKELYTNKFYNFAKKVKILKKIKLS